MRTRKQIADAIHRPEKGVGVSERQLQVEAVILELLLDIRDLLGARSNNMGEVVVDFVPPDYGKENKLV